MEFDINGITLSDSTEYKLESPIEGLETPPIRTSQDNYSGRDGGSVNGQFYSPRLITLTGFIKGETCDAHETARQALQAALPIRTDLGTTVTTFNGDSYDLTVRLLDLKMPYTDRKKSEFKIDIVATDPYLYTSDELSAVLVKNVGGGFILPVILPIVFDPGSTSTIVTNNGSVIVYPVIEIVGSATNPRITKVATGEKVELGITMSGGDVLRIDLKAHTITLNGGSVLGYRTADSDWWGLEPGANAIAYDTTNGGDTGVATIYWRTAVISI